MELSFSTVQTKGDENQVSGDLRNWEPVGMRFDGHLGENKL